MKSYLLRDGHSCGVSTKVCSRNYDKHMFSAVWLRNIVASAPDVQSQSMENLLLIFFMFVFVFLLTGTSQNVMGVFFVRAEAKPKNTEQVETVCQNLPDCHKKGHSQSQSNNLT